MSHDTKRNLIDDLLVEQQTLTAVDLFSKRHEEGSLPKQAKYYRDLIPLEKPKSGQQFAFAVDLDACTGCKACVSACHSLNGLGYEETWRDVGLLIGGNSTQPVQQTVTTACHHCLNPACLAGCPVDAYEKDAATGIVRHLDDQCIGCQYCTLTCPYEVPKYSKKHGIVRKCDMCTNRLAVGEAPACVQACPNSAIRIEIVDQRQVAETSVAEARLVPGTVASDYTQPTTRYRTKKTFPENMGPADQHHLEPEESHWPVVLMLALKQASVGAFALSFFYGTPMKLLLTLATALLGIVIGTFHLGRPMYAWRAVVGLGHSWLSREIVIFGIYAGLAMAFVGTDWLPELRPFRLALGISVVVVGVVGIVSSMMIYHVTRRAFWHASLSGPRFVGTAFVLGGAIMGVPLLVIGATLVKLLFEATIFRHLKNPELTLLKKSALLMSGPLLATTLARFFFAILGGIGFPLLAIIQGPLVPILILSFVFSLIAEILERNLFFAAVVGHKMPGGVRV